ncbi:MAG: MlaD family protein [Pasteurellaceae bacterium]|nr:MlaD family protein [Pasteurellaceae bacterium]
MSEHLTEVIPAKVRPPRRISPFWLLPLVAFMIGGLLFFQILQERGEDIRIRFEDGAGISAGKTAIRYQGLQIGVVKKVAFTNELREVEVIAEINAEARSVLKKDTKFWLVRPTASLAGVSGLDTLVSGNYITLLPGESEESEDEFVAESEPPLVPVNDGDLMVKLIANDLGSIAVGASVYFRKVPVGTISDYRFTVDQQHVEIEAVINKKYAHLVKKTSRFWNISGIKANVSLAQGLSIDVDSLMSVVQGAVAFDSPIDAEPASQAEQYPLYTDLKSAQRGIEVSIDVPATVGLKANETGVFYQGVQIGVLASLESAFDSQNEEKQTGMLAGALLIDPSYQDLLKEDSQIILKQPKFSFGKDSLTKVGEVLRGHYFELIAGKSSEPGRVFTVKKNDDFLLNRPDTVSFTLVSPQSYGVDQGQGIYYHDVKIGEILKRDLSIENVKFTAIIFPDYRHLVGENSKFVTISNLDVSVSLDGVRFNAGSPSSWLQGGIKLLDGNAKGKVQSQYPLYRDRESAENGITSHEQTPTLTLSANDLSGIGKDSVLLYRHFEVGKVLNIRPKKNGFDVDLYLEPKYRHLLTDTSRFWIEPAVQVDVSMQGLNVQASPLMRTLKGAISFDNKGGRKSQILHKSFSQANAGNTHITLTANDASTLSEGMPLKYRGLKVGQVDTLKLDKKQIKISAFIEPQYYPLVAKSGSRFKAISPEISTTGVKNLDAALQNYINVDIGSGESKTQFALDETENGAAQYHNGLPIIVETTDANGITPDAPVLYRGMQVGAVQRLSLSELGDRVLIHLRISPQYQHLVRKNSQFWTASGYTMDISLSGASINSGTMSQLLNGGIAFSNPSGMIVQGQAEPNRRFRLQRKIPEGALGWDQGIAE